MVSLLEYYLVLHYSCELIVVLVVGAEGMKSLHGSAGGAGAVTDPSVLNTSPLIPASVSRHLLVTCAVGKVRYKCSLVLNNFSD